MSGKPQCRDCEWCDNGVCHVVPPALSPHHDPSFLQAWLNPLVDKKAEHCSLFRSKDVLTD